MLTALAALSDRAWVTTSDTDHGRSVPPDAAGDGLTVRAVSSLDRATRGRRSPHRRSPVRKVSPPCRTASPSPAGTLSAAVRKARPGAAAGLGRIEKVADRAATTVVESKRHGLFGSPILGEEV